MAQGDEVLLQGRGIPSDAIEVTWGVFTFAGLRSVSYGVSKAKENVGFDSDVQARSSGKKERMLSVSMDGWAYLEMTNILVAANYDITDVMPMMLTLNVKKSVEGESFGGLPVVDREDGLWTVRTFPNAEVREVSEQALDRGTQDGSPVTLTFIVG